MDSSTVANRFETLYDISCSLNSSLDLQVVMQTIMDQLIVLTRAERGFLALVDPATGDLSFDVARNLEKETLEAPEFSVSRTLIRRVIENRKGELLLSAMEDPDLSKARSVVLQNLRSIVCVPLEVHDRVLGVVYVDNRKAAGIFKKADLEILTAFANLAAIALENARLYTEILDMKAYQDAIFQSVESAIVTVDTTSRVTTFNRSAERIFARPRGDVLDRPLHEALPLPAAEALRPLMQEVLEEHRPILGLEHAGSSDATGPMHLILNLAPLRTADDAEIGVTLIADDISERIRLQEERDAHASERRKLRVTLGRLVSEEVAELAERGPDALTLGGQRRDVTILFADLVGFTPRSQNLPPERIIEMLNRYYAAMCEIAQKWQGMVKQFVGDELMLLFNATRDTDDHAMLGVCTAVDMIDRLLQMAASDPSREMGFYDVKIGVHTGSVVVGGIGAENRMEFTAIGDNVNLASRIMGLNPTLGTRILISEETRRAVGDRLHGVLFHPLGPQQVKGRTSAVNVYEVFRPSWL